MRLLWITDDAGDPGLGEPTQWIADAGPRLAERGHRIHVLALAPGSHAARTIASSGVRTTTVPAERFAETLASTLTTTPDLVHLFASSGALAPLLDPIAVHPTLVDAWHPAARDVIEAARAWAGALAARSTWLRDTLAAGHGRGIERLEPGVDSMRFRPDVAAPADPVVRAALERDERPRVIWLGPPSEARGARRLLDLLVALHARVHGVRMIVAGSDPEHPRAGEVLQAEARELGLAGSLCLIPRISHADLPVLLAGAQVAVAPALEPEPTGLFMRQALAAAVPVVAHAAGCARELIVDRQNGRLVPPGDLPGFAQAVASLLQDHAWRGMCAEQARLTAIERHDLEPSLFTLEDLYHRVRTGGQRDARPAA